MALNRKLWKRGGLRLRELTIEQLQGDYYFKFDAINVDGRRIYCLETNIRLVERNDEDRAGGEGDASLELWDSLLIT